MNKVIKFLSITLIAVLSITDANADENSDIKTPVASVVYFSATTHTRDVASVISTELNIESFEIIPKDPYSKEDLDYTNANSRVSKEFNDRSIRTGISNDLSAALKADTIFLGSPVWFSRAPSVILTFLDKYNLKEKRIYLFVTSGGSPVSLYEKEIKTLHPELNIEGAVRFQQTGNDNAVKEWLKTLKLD